MISYEKFSHNLKLEVEIVWKISALKWNTEKIEMSKNSWISKNFN